jgi:hypothetical protein
VLYLESQVDTWMEIFHYLSNAILYCWFPESKAGRCFNGEEVPNVVFWAIILNKDIDAHAMAYCRGGRQVIGSVGDFALKVIGAEANDKIKVFQNPIG